MRDRRLLPVLFVFTGATGLLLEQILEKLLGTLLGTSTPAAAVVLAVYFLGLTLGGWSYPLWQRARIRPIRVYAIAEGGVASCALILYLAFDSLIPLFVPLLRHGANDLQLLQMLRIVVAACWVLPPTILMGVTFPAVADALADFVLAEEDRGRAVAAFYALNLLGAFAGAVLGPYVVFPYLGLAPALLSCALIDGAVSVAAFTLRSSQIAVVEERKQIEVRGSVVWLLLAAAGVSGFLFFGLEVLWTHLIGVTFGNSIYAFAVMLAIVLLGLLIGGWIAARFFGTDKPVLPRHAAICLLVAAALLAIQHRIWPYVPHQFTVWGVGYETFAAGEMLKWAIAVVVLLPSTIALGVVYPLLFRIVALPDDVRGVIVGRMAALNAVGSVCGALVMGFVLIPALGSEVTLILVVIIYAVTGTVIALLDRDRQRKIFPALGGCAVLLMIGLASPWDRMALTSGEHVYFRPFVGPNTSLLFFHEDTAGGITTVVQTPTPNGITRTLLTNGKFQGNDGGEVSAQAGFVLVPALHARRFDRALVIGLGTGNGAHLVDALGFRRIDIAEIAPGILEAADGYFNHLNGNVLHKPHVHVHLEDGRNFLLLDDAKYDFVTMELSSVWFAGVTNLYCREFYTIVRDHMQPDGVFQQWVQVHHLGGRELTSAIVTLRAVFPYVSFWYVGGQGILVGSLQPQQVQPATLRLMVERSNALGFGRGVMVPAAVSLLDTRLLSPADTDRLARAARVPINSDRNRFFEYFTPRFNLALGPMQLWNIRMLSRFASYAPPEVAGHDPQVEAIVRHSDARRYFFQLMPQRPSR